MHKVINEMSRLAIVVLEEKSYLRGSRLEGMEEITHKIARNVAEQGDGGKEGEVGMRGVAGQRAGMYAEMARSKAKQGPNTKWWCRWRKRCGRSKKGNENDTGSERAGSINTHRLNQQVV